MASVHRGLHAAGGGFAVRRFLGGLGRPGQLLQLAAQLLDLGPDLDDLLAGAALGLRDQDLELCQRPPWQIRACSSTGSCPGSRSTTGCWKRPRTPPCRLSSASSSWPSPAATWTSSS